MSRCTASLLALSLLILGGCGSGDPHARHAVNGIVSLDGEPLATGAIAFFPESQGAVATGGEIKNGEFVIPVDQGLPVGNYKVSITATVSTAPSTSGPSDPIENPPVVKSLVPRQYNSETTLKAEVHESGENFLAFDLTSS